MKGPPSQAVFGDPLTGGFHCFPRLSHQGSHQAMPHKRLLCSTTFSKDSSLPSSQQAGDAALPKEDLLSRLLLKSPKSLVLYLAEAS